MRKSWRPGQEGGLSIGQFSPITHLMYTKTHLSIFNSKIQVQYLKLDRMHSDGCCEDGNIFKQHVLHARVIKLHRWSQHWWLLMLNKCMKFHCCSNNTFRENIKYHKNVLTKQWIQRTTLTLMKKWQKQLYLCTVPHIFKLPSMR